MNKQVEAMKLALEALWTTATPKTEHAVAALQEALAEQPAQQEPVAEVKAKMTGGNVGIATVIHEIYSPIREPLQPGDKLYPAYRWIGWDVEQVWSERIFGIDMRFENVQDAIAFRKKLDEATTPQAQRKPLTDGEKQQLAENWFAEDWAITKAIGMMFDHELLLGIKE